MTKRERNTVIRAVVNVLLKYKEALDIRHLARKAGEVHSIRNKPYLLISIERMLDGRDKMNQDVKKAIHYKHFGNEEQIEIWDDPAAMEEAVKRKQRRIPPTPSLFELMNDWTAPKGCSASLRYLPTQTMRVGKSDQVPRLWSGKHDFLLCHKGFSRPHLILLDCDPSEEKFWSLLQCQYARIGGAVIDQSTQLDVSTEIKIEITPLTGESELYAIVLEGEFPGDDIGEFMPEDGSNNAHEITKIADACRIVSGLKHACVARCRYRV